MTVSVLTGLTLQAVAAWLVHKGIRGQWLRRSGALLLAMAILGHGITEVMQWAWPGRNSFRRYIGQDALGDWVLLVSTAILIYAIAYVVVIRSVKPVEPQPVDGEKYLAGLRLRWLFVVTVPLLVLTWQGRGALQPVAPGQEASHENYATVGLAGEFLVPLVAIIGAVVLVRYGTRWLIPLLAVQGAVLVVAGTRSMIVQACLLSLVGAALCGVRPSRRQVAAVVVLVASFTFVISSTRAAVGREVFTADQGAGERVDGLAKGVGNIASARSREAILDDVVYRFDSNTYGALVLQSLRADTTPVGLATVGNSIMLLVPSFLTPGKLSRSIESRNEEAYVDRQFGIDQSVDWLPSIFGTMLAWFGPAGLIILAMILGLVLAAGESIALRRSTTARWLFALGLAQSSLLYAAGPQTFIVLMRGPLLAVAVFAGVRAASPVLRKVKPAGQRSAHTVWPPSDLPVREPTRSVPTSAIQPTAR